MGAISQSIRQEMTLSMKNNILQLESDLSKQRAVAEANVKNNILQLESDLSKQRAVAEANVNNYNAVDQLRLYMDKCY